MTGRAKSRPKKKKKPFAPNWFYKLTAAQLKQLLQASKQKVSGNKSDMITRLEYNPSTSIYGDEPTHLSYNREGEITSEGRPGKWKANLEEDCRSAGLKASGTKFELVLRLLQHQHGVGNPAPLPKPRKPSTKPPNLDKLRQRIANKCCKDMSNASNNATKQHGPRVLRDCMDIIEKEAFSKGFAAKGDPLALEICEAVLCAFADHSYEIRLGYCYFEANMAGGNLKKVIELVRSNLTAEQKRHHAASWIEHFASVFSRLGSSLDDDWQTGLKKLLLSPGEEEREEIDDEEEEGKRSAKRTKHAQEQEHAQQKPEALDRLSEARALLGYDCPFVPRPSIPSILSNHSNANANASSPSSPAAAQTTQPAPSCSPGPALPCSAPAFKAAEAAALGQSKTLKPTTSSPAGNGNGNGNGLLEQRDREHSTPRPLAVHADTASRKRPREQQVHIDIIDLCE